jgi:hypothetical protein
LDRIREDLAPYRGIGLQGAQALPWLLNLQGDPRYSALGAGGEVYGPDLAYQYFQPTMAQLQQTPGYQFALNEGLRAVINNAAARGLAGSGAQARGMMQFATGLASNTYQQQLGNHMAQFGTDLNARLSQNAQRFGQQVANDTNLYNRLMGVAGLGQNSAALSANLGMAGAGQIGSNLIGGGNAAASGAIGSANAIAGGLNAIAGAAQQSLVLNRLLGNTTSGFNNPLASSGVTDPSTISRR